MTIPHLILLVVIMAMAGGNLLAMTVQMVIGGIVTLVGLSLITLGSRDRALDLVEKSL